MRWWSWRWGVEIRPLSKYNFFSYIFGPPFFLSAALVFGRRPGGRETMARCADPRVQRLSAGRRDVGVVVAAAAVLHTKGALQWFQPAAAELSPPSACTEHIDLTGSVAECCTVLNPPSTPSSPNPQYKYPSCLRLYSQSKPQPHIAPDSISTCSVPA